MSIDEVSLSKGELYTFVTNKEGKGKSGTLVAVVAGTKAEDIQKVLEKISLDKRNLVEEITLDMAKNMESGVKAVFPKAILVTDRFHVVKLALDALQHLRVQLRWEAMDTENNALAAIKTAKKEFENALMQAQGEPEKQAQAKQVYEAKVAQNQPIVFENGDSPKQLLARSRYILTKKETEWTKNQKERADILFSHYPTLSDAYYLVLSFRNIYEQTNVINANKQFEHWIKKVKDNELKQFYSVANTVSNNLENILNFFNNRNTNANAESFNAKIKLFRANLRGVTDTKFFLFRLHKLFA